MKSLLLSGILFLALPLFQGLNGEISANGGSPADSAAVYETVYDAIADTVFTVNVDMAYPMTGRSVNLTSGYSISVDKDRIVSYLPYFGRAYSVPYGGGDGLVFEAEISEYSCTDGKKGQKLLVFGAKTDEDSFTFHLTVFPDGTASLSVTSINRQSISYSGEVIPASEKTRKNRKKIW